MLMAYTSSGTWRGTSPTIPLGVIEFGEAAARLLNQRPFHLDLRCLARTLLTSAWFPRIEQQDRGVVAAADQALRDRINREAETLAVRRSQIIEIRGVQP